ncbi:DUF7010 family protein [Litorimonas sp. WD9-15]|uniref:DUF7010 family protein n=1 Tax=Litorimonas sp. WD9-15 TaxID=3418716 RepID=UPI003D04E6D3
MTSLATTTPPDMETLKAQLTEHRLAQYIRLSGGAPIPIAGAIYWAALAWVGTFSDLQGWAAIAFPLSGAIFPLALIFAKILKCNFMKDKSAIGDVLLPTLISMLLFWPMLFMAGKSASPELIVPILAIGMSLHWPVIGWGYARTTLYTAHAVIRAVVVTYIWFTFPEHMLTLLPLSVALIYIATVIAIYVDVARLKSKPSFTLKRV